MGFEPMTSPLPTVCSTPELQRRVTGCYSGPGRTRTYEALAADLQSAPFAARDTDPFSRIVLLT